MGFELSEKEKDDLLYRPLPPHFGFRFEDCFEEEKEEEEEEPKSVYKEGMSYKEFVDAHRKEYKEHPPIQEDFFNFIQRLAKQPPKKGEIRFGGKGCCGCSQK